MVIEMMPVDSRLSSKLSLMSFVCAVMICFTHAAGPDDAGAVSWFLWNLVRTNIYVPFFFVASGYLLARHIDEPDWYWREVKKRIRTVFMPFLFWAAVGLCYCQGMAIWADFYHGRAFGTTAFFTTDKIFSAFGLYPGEMPLLYPLWYLRSILLLTCLSAVLSWCLKRSCLVTLFLLACALIVVNILPLGQKHAFIFGWMSVRGLFWFAVGISLFRRPVRITLKLAMGLLVVGLVLHIIRFSLPLPDGIKIPLELLQTPFILAGFWGVLPQGGGFLLRTLPMRIYVTHLFGLAFFATTLGNVFPKTLMFTCAQVVFALIVSGIISFALHLVPRLESIAFGGR